jgi:transposase
MATPRIYATPTPDQLEELKDLADHPRTPRSSLWRIQIIIMSADKIQTSKIQSITRKTMKTILKIIHAFNQNGLSAVFEADHLGRIAAFTPSMETFTLELIRGEYPQTATSITETLNQVFAQQLTQPLQLSCVYYHLRRMGLSWQRSRYVPKGKADPETKAALIGRLDDLKKKRVKS